MIVSYGKLKKLCLVYIIYRTKQERLISMRILMLIFTILLCNINTSTAQYAADKDAMYLATIKAVADYKINDEETIAGMNRLRQNQNFNRKLYEMIQKLDNSRNKDGKNARIHKILLRAGKDIYNELK